MLREFFSKAARGVADVAKDAAYFTKSAIVNPAYTLRTTFEGMKNVGTLDNGHTGGALGATVGFFGATAVMGGGIFSPAAGIFSLVGAAGGFLRHGESLLKPPGEEPDAAKPASASGPTISP